MAHQQHPSTFGIRPSEASAASGELPSSDRPTVTAATLFAGSEGGMGSGASRPHHSTVILPLPASGHHWGGRAPRLPLFDNAFGRADTAVGVPRSSAAPLWRAHLPPAVGGAPPLRGSAAARGEAAASSLDLLGRGVSPPRAAAAAVPFEWANPYRRSTGHEQVTRRAESEFGLPLHRPLRAGYAAASPKPEGILALFVPRGTPPLAAPAAGNSAPLSPEGAPSPRAPEKWTSGTCPLAPHPGPTLSQPLATPPSSPSPVGRGGGIFGAFPTCPPEPRGTPEARNVTPTLSGETYARPLSLPGTPSGLSPSRAAGGERPDAGRPSWQMADVLKRLASPAEALPPHLGLAGGSSGPAVLPAPMVHEGRPPPASSHGKTDGIVAQCHSLTGPPPPYR